MKPLKICIVGLKCFDQIAGNPVPRYLGGIETQLAVLAKGLVKEGCEVSLITYDHGQREPEIFDGVTVLKSYNPDRGLRGLRWFARSKRLWDTVQRADADIYLQMGAGSETGQVAWGCHSRGKRRRFVFCMASDANYGVQLREGKFGWEGKVYQYGLRRADLILAQTQRQRDGLRNAVGLDSQIIPMAVVSPLHGQVAKGPDSHPPRVLWVGRITREKRLEWLIEIARQCPEFGFDIVGTPNEASEHARRLLVEASDLPNVKAHGRLAGDELKKLYQAAQVLCCTSTLEGFPTTFLEAWSCGMPVVTTFDPDGIVARYGLGKVAESPTELVSHLKNTLGNQPTYAGLSDAAKRYYLEHHTVEAVSRKFRLAFEELVRKH